MTTTNDPAGALGSDCDGPGPVAPGSGPDGACIRFRTMTGSLYEIDLVAMTWRRTPTLASGRLPIEGGALVGLTLGGPGTSATLLYVPLDGGPLRAIWTSALVAYGVDGADETIDRDWCAPDG